MLNINEWLVWLDWITKTINDYYIDHCLCIGILMKLPGIWGSHSRESQVLFPGEFLDGSPTHMTLLFGRNFIKKLIGSKGWIRSLHYQFLPCRNPEWDKSKCYLVRVPSGVETDIPEVSSLVCHPHLLERQSRGAPRRLVGRWGCRKTEKGIRKR